MAETLAYRASLLHHYCNLKMCFYLHSPLNCSHQQIHLGSLQKRILWHKTPTFIPGWAQLSLQASQDQCIGFSTPAMFYLFTFASNTEYVCYSDILM